MKLTTSFTSCHFIKMNFYLYGLIVFIILMISFIILLFSDIGTRKKDIVQLNHELIDYKKSHYDFSQLEQVSVEKLTELKDKITIINELQIDKDLAILKMMIELEKMLSKHSFVEMMGYERNESGGTIRIYDENQQRLSEVLTKMKESVVFTEVSLVKQMSQKKGNKKGFIYEILYSIH